MCARNIIRGRAPRGLVQEVEMDTRTIAILALVVAVILVIVLFVV